MDQQPTRTDPQSRGQASRTATAIVLATILAISTAVVWAATNGVASEDGATRGAQRSPFPREEGVGACLRITRPSIVDSRPFADTLAAEAAAHDHLFPQVGITTVPKGPSSADTIVALWPGGLPPGAKADALPPEQADACALGDGDWAFGVTRDLLTDGADRLLARAEFGSDWSAVIDVSLHPTDARVRSTLHFRGPFGIEGSCWIDETLAIDLESGLPAVSSTSGNDAGLPGLVACRRFEAEMAEGGAGAQAMALFPSTLAAEDTEMALVPTGVEVNDDLVVVYGGDA